MGKSENNRKEGWKGEKQKKKEYTWRSTGEKKEEGEKNERKGVEEP